MTSWRDVCAGVLLGSVLGGAPPLSLSQEVVAIGAMEQVKAGSDDPLLSGTERFEQGATDVTEVNLDKAMMAMAAKFLEKSDAEAQRLMRNMEFVHVKTFEYGKDARYRMTDVEQFRARLDASWSHLVKERSATEATDVWVKADGEGQFSELMVIAAEPKELTFVHLKGHMTMDELERAGASYGVPQGNATLQKRGK